MSIIDIGTATINYNESGKVKTASFIAGAVNATPELINQLRSLNGAENEEIIKDNAGLLLGSFFSQISNIELADRDQWEIITEIQSCSHYSNGNVKTCAIKFLFKKLEIFSNN